MQLLTQELQRSIPPLYSQEQTDDPAVVCAFFLPATNRTWYVLEGATREPEGCGFGQNCDHRPLSEYDPARDDVLFFGYVVGDEAELGYFSLSELTRIRGPFGLGVERDRYFEPCRLSVLKQAVAVQVKPDAA